MMDKLRFRQTLLIVFCCLALVDTLNASGKRLPDVQLIDTTGKSYSLRHWQGQPVLINFWATWCAPCRKEMPDLASLQTELKQQGLQVLGVAIDNAEAVQTYLNKSPVTYPILLAPDTGSALSTELGNHQGVLPFSVFVDQSGNIERTHIGVVTKKMVKNWILTQSVNSK